jgi:EpsI family protein
MNNTAVRIFVVAVLAAGVYLAAIVVGGAGRPPKVRMPSRDLHELPRQLGSWTGVDQDLDRRTFNAIGAKVVVDRLYKDQRGNGVLLHTAVFDDPQEGVYHSPMNCYRSSGWNKLDEARVPLDPSDPESILVDTSIWEREGQKILVVYWYELGEHVLYGRLDLGAVRFAMRNEREWPALVKVMLQTPMDQSEQRPRELALDVGRRVHDFVQGAVKAPATEQAPPPTQGATAAADRPGGP